ncbi:MAG: ABC transporter permease [Clostridia bacterium]|nr:ABC transporter permease [Clostridia bacterium]
MYDDKKTADNGADFFHAAELDGSVRPPVPADNNELRAVTMDFTIETPISKATTDDLTQTRHIGTPVPPADTVSPGETIPPMRTVPPMRTIPPMNTTPPSPAVPFRTVPPTSGVHASSHDSGKGLLQIQIYTRKFWRTLRKESLISILIGIVITLLVMYVTHDGMFDTFESTKSGLFALICVCVWLGIFNSIQLVCREKNDIVKDELDKSLHATSYMAAHFIYQAVLCAVQSVLVFITFFLFVSPDGNPFMYFLVIYMVMFASDAMAFVLSSAVPNPIVAMTFMPLLLLIQLVMAGVMFELKGFSVFLSYFTISRWGMSAFGLIGEIADLPSKVASKMPPGVSYSALTDTDKAMYEGGGGDIALCICMFLLFIVAFYFLSVLALKLTTRRIKK